MRSKLILSKNNRSFTDLNNSAGLLAWASRNSDKKISWKTIRRKYPDWFNGNILKKEYTLNLKSLMEDIHSSVKDLKISYDEVQENNIIYPKINSKVFSTKFYRYKLIPLSEKETLQYKTIFCDLLNFLEEAYKTNSEIIFKW